LSDYSIERFVGTRLQGLAMTERKSHGGSVLLVVGFFLVFGCSQPRTIRGPVSVGIVESSPERTEATYDVCGSVQITPDPGGKYTVTMTDVRMEYPVEDSQGHIENRVQKVGDLTIAGVARVSTQKNDSLARVCK
jgi:hypothetical protein